MTKDLVNLGALTCIQASNALVPLVVFPFLLHTLGAAAYADVVLAESLALLVLAVVVFSFDVTGVSDLVRLRHDDDRDGMSRLLSSVLFLRLALLIPAAAAAIGFYTLVLGKSLLMISLWTLVPLAYIFQSIWLYQGFERNLPLALFTLVSRVLSVGLILIFVRDNLDGALVPAILGTTYFAGGLAAFGYALRHHHLRVCAVSWAELARTARDGKEVFFGNLAVTMQRDINVLILGVVAVPAAALAAYSVAEKLTKSLQAVARPLNQLFFPKVIRSIKDDLAPTPEVARKILRQTIPQLAIVLALLAALTIAYFIAWSALPAIRAYPNIAEISGFLAIMGPTVTFGIVSFMFGSVGLNSLGRRMSFLQIVLVTGCTSALLCFLLSYWIGAIGAVACYAGAEIATALLVLNQYRRRSPPPTPSL